MTKCSDPVAHAMRNRNQETGNLAAGGASYEAGLAGPVRAAGEPFGAGKATSTDVISTH
ncbi:hypothetical protein GCM10009533_30820 [Saccharopolyspora spinosporotrichia]|uniref:Uncharacterized protein n=1 Tax=Saccharopolyspora erythraea TaxID=1836 RepID=A0ABP3MZC2_SACER